MSRLGGRFVLEREIGSGGMASVYLGTDEVLERRVAVKVLKPGFQESDVGIRFRREGRTAARLSHPNIVQVYDAGEDDLDGRKVSYIVMEHISGGDLRQKIEKRGTLSTEEVSNLSGIAAGLAHAHGRGVVHRDVKPHNVLMEASGQPKVTDFGIARALDATQVTRTGMYLGTARYSSPEQLQGEETTEKSDVYSLGVTLYEAVTGNPPFSGTPIEIATQHVHKPPSPPGELAPTDEGTEALILDCLAKDPEDRPTADTVEKRLKELAQSTGATRQHAMIGAAGSGGDGGPTGPTGAAYVAPRAGADGRSSRRLPVAVALVTVLVLAGALGAYALLGRDNNAAQAPAATTQETTPQTTAQETPDSRTGNSPIVAPTTDQTVARQGSPANSEPQPGTDSGRAAQVVKDVYSSAAAGDYGRSYDLLSQNFKQNQAPTQAQWSGQFDTLESISFVEGPDAQVSGDTAQVTGTTRAVHTDRTERNTVAWTLVRQDGEWKLDSINLIDRTVS